MATPLRKTYSKSHPYVVERHDQEDGAIHYEIWDHRPDSYRRLCTICEPDVEDVDLDDDEIRRGQAKRDAEMIVRALNLNNGGLP